MHMGKAVKHYIKQNKELHLDLAKRVGLSEPGMSRAIRSPILAMPMVIRMCKGIDVKMSEFILQAEQY